MKTEDDQRSLTVAPTLHAFIEQIVYGASTMCYIVLGIGDIGVNKTDVVLAHI